MSTFEPNLKLSWNSTIPPANASRSDGFNCVVTFSSDGGGDLVSPETELLLSKLKAAVFMPLIFVCGGPLNLINAVVFVKQGLQDRVNVCLFSLAVVDFVSICFIFLLYAEQPFMFNSPDAYGPMSAFIVNNKLLIFYSSMSGSMFLSLIIALERCYCVLFPLHAKSFLTTKKMVAIILTTVPFICFLRLVVTAKYAVVCFFDKRRQLTYTGLYVTEYQARNRELLDFVDGIFYGIFLTLGCPAVILIATVMTSVTLWQNVRWRKRASIASTNKEIAVTKMLILLSLQVLVFDIPVILLRLGPLFNAEFNPRGKYRLFLLACAYVAEVCIYAGPSFSFVVYLSSSSRYQKTCRNIFTPRFCRKDNRGKRLNRKTRTDIAVD